MAERQRGRPRLDDGSILSREQMLDAALTAFAEFGYVGMSVRELCRSLGVSHGLMNLRFGSKEMLWRACIEHGLRKVGERLREADPGGGVADRFRAIVITTLEAMAAVPALLQIANHESAKESPQIEIMGNTLAIEQQIGLQGIIDQGVEAGLFRPMSRNLVTVLMLHGGGAVFTLPALAQRWGLLDAKDPTDVRRLAGEIAEFLLQGLLVRK
jgi:AcrR family transcriptional regulator